ncbi:MAG: NAD(P)-dependent oxidoreductase [Brumimicrobium sp.]
MSIKLGIIKEGKAPPDKRVPLGPNQVLRLKKEFPQVEVFVQKSDIRAFKDEEYSKLGIPVVDSLKDCDIIMGVKEVNIEDLIPNKHFFFFSHTYKKQTYNRDLLRAIVDQKIQLTDYEMLKDEKGNRIIGFGRYAGIVGCYNGFRTFGLKHKLYDLKPAHQCEDRKEMEGELPKIKLPKDFKLVVSGYGRVGHGTKEILDLIGIRKVTPEEFLTDKFDEPVFTRIDVKDYNKKSDGKPFVKKHFYADGAGHESTFPRYLKVADMFIAGHYWKEGSPFLYTREDLKDKSVKTSVVADISCDIDGPVASTIRPSTIENPIYGYHPLKEKEVNFMDEDAIAVMAVDNLPCELPKDASKHFGRTLIEKVFPLLFGDDPHRIIENASETTKNGELSPNFKYLQAYLDGKE